MPLPPNTTVGRNLETGAPVSYAQAMRDQAARGGKDALMTGVGLLAPPIPPQFRGESQEPLLHRGLLGARPDGTQKGYGYMGLLARPEGGWSTEISAGIEIDGQEVEIPLLVPTLTESEKKWLLAADTDAGDFYEKLPAGIMGKAIAHAKQRIADGLSPFKD
jgi:hypothetical protein